MASKTRRFEVRLSEREHERLKQMARLAKVKPSQLLRNLLRGGIEISLR